MGKKLRILPFGALSYSADCHSAHCRSADCYSAHCRSADCRRGINDSADCRSADCRNTAMHMLVAIVSGQRLMPQVNVGSFVCSGVNSAKIYHFRAYKFNLLFKNIYIWN